jgi:multidrug efflux pump subunit AcrA (membrane-fusion protein)
MVARVTLAIGQPREALLVPKDAIVLRGGSQFIFLVDNNLAVQKPVQPGISLDGFVEVIGDLSEGMQVVVQGNERLLPGQRVRTVS